MPRYTRPVLTLSACVIPGPGIQGRGYQQVEDQKGRWQIRVMEGKRRGRRGCGSRGKRVGEEAEKICSIFLSVKERSTFKLIQLSIFRGQQSAPTKN